VNAGNSLVRRAALPALLKAKMKPRHLLRMLGLTGLGCVVAGSALAQGREAPYFYGGVSLGGSQARIDDESIVARLRIAGLATTGMSRDESSLAYKLFGGYQFTPNWAVEAGYFNLGKFGFAATTTPTGILTGEAKFQGVNLDLVGTLPLDERWSVLGRVGVQYGRTRDTFSRSGAVAVTALNPSSSDANYKFGVGIQYAVSPGFLIRGELERYRVNDAVGNRGDINAATVSLVFPFGASAAAPVRSAPTYVEPVAAVAPATVQAETVAAAPIRRVSFSADSLFGFDRAEVTAPGKVALDRFGADLAPIQFEVITVEGHTDRLGSVSHNQRLSVQRAEAVKAYLAQSGRIDPRKIVATGKASTAPVTKAGECKGSQPSPALIACLQPDRRVEVGVVGVR